MLDKGEISFSVFNYLHNKTCRTPILYFLPQIHKGKTSPPGRPILSAGNSDTEKISKFIDHFLNPCATTGQSYIKDTTDFLNILEGRGPILVNSWLITLDVTSLYTTIGNAQDLLDTKEDLDRFRPNPNVKPSNKSLIELMEFVLVFTKNNFTFNSVFTSKLQGQSWVQKWPLAMPMSSWDNLKMTLSIHTPPNHLCGNISYTIAFKFASGQAQRKAWTTLFTP